MRTVHRHSLITVAGAPIALVAAASLVAFTAPRAAADTADGPWSCNGLPSYTALKSALTAARQQTNGGFNLDMWATVVNRDGIVCAVAFTGSNRGDQWPGSRVISAQKANTANAFSLPSLALSTANLYSAVQPGGSLYGLQHSNPVDTEVAYRGPAANFGQSNDPMVGHRIGGVNVFGGGLALYDASHKLLGAIGVSGDSSCADHNIAWRTRSTLKLDHVPAGVSGDALRPDNIVYDITSLPGEPEGVSASGWGHPVCTAAAQTVAAGLPMIEP
ncbi:MAG: heme-binding protein [Gammaproteobacteria bacterium]|nr:heme-binding protein [Gammaproteobacteria bacterium]MDE2261794.1 heme-binding protein [Gammaproteobacteria bacterium]